MNVQDRYNEVMTFNEIAGNLTDVTVEKLEAQMKVVAEEVKELQDAFDSQNSLELLDGACDAFVTLSGLIQQMEKAGFNVNGALKAVNENNLSKYISRVLTDEEWEYYQSLGWDTVYNDEYDCYVLKDQNGKIRKPVGFQSVDIMDYLPNDFFGGAA